MITVRVADQADLHAIEIILRESYPEFMAASYEPSILEWALPMMIEANPRLIASGTYYLCEVDGEPAGCGGWTFEAPGSHVIEAGMAHIRHFGVRPCFARTGVGTRLYKRCEADALSAGANRFSCFSSLNGEAFYIALGFGSEGRIHVPMGRDKNLPGVLMTRPL